MPDLEHYRKLERMYAAAPINKYFYPRITIHEGEAEIMLPVNEKLFHAAGSVHGAVYFKALDDAAYFAASSLVDDVFLVTVTFNLILTKPIKTGELRAFGKVIHRSRRLYVAEAELIDSEKSLAAKGSGTFMRSKIELGPEIGYI